jgi:hypothetical protein
MPVSGAENAPITFICELEKQIRRGLVLLGEGQSAISDRAGAAHGISNPNATEQGFKYGKNIWVRPDRLSAGDPDDPIVVRNRPVGFLNSASGRVNFFGSI